MTPSWYDVLGIETDASPDQIRAAWKDTIADLDPGDRRFRLSSSAAEVLLDPERRAAHDAELAKEVEEARRASEADAPAAAVDTPVVIEKDDDAEPLPSRGRRRRMVVGAVLAVLATVLTVLTVLAVVDDRSTSQLPDAKAVAAARAAAEEAVVPVLSYDYRTLARDQREARSYLTTSYAQQYDRFFQAAVLANAPRTKTVVRVRVLDSGIVRTGPGRVDVLLFVNRPTLNKQRATTYHDQVTMRMVETDGTWLVGCMITSPGTPCDT